jgi:hypothetical protein
MPRKERYTFRFLNVPVNGHVSKADLQVVEKDTEQAILCGRLNPQDQDERLRLGKKWAKPLRLQPEEIADAINNEWIVQLGKLQEVAADGSGETGGRTQAQTLLALAAAAEYFHSPDSVAYATVRLFKHGQSRETMAVRGQLYRSWLARSYFGATGKAPGSQTVHDVISVLEAQGRYDGPTIPVHVRIAGHEDAIYIDLGDNHWRAIEVRASGWSVVESYPVKFRRPKGLLPLPVPEHGGSVVDLRPFINVAEEDWVLILGWLLSTMRPVGPYPLLVLHGEQGAAKTTTARILRRLIDPNVALVRPAPRDDHDLIIAGSNSWMVALDNLSGVKDWLSDALCRMSTGGGFATRQLYTDAEEAIFDVQRPVLLTGIDTIPTRNDLLDRAVVVDAPVIDDERRKPESQLYAEFEQKWPSILGAFLNMLCGALRELPRVQIQSLPRMADFAMLAVAGIRSLGMRDPDFLDPYTSNQARAFGLSLDHPIVDPLYALLKSREDQSWEGTMTQLLEALEGQITPKNGEKDPKKGHSGKKKGWPRGPEQLSSILHRLAPALRRGNKEDERNISVTFQPRTSKARGIRLELLKPEPNVTDEHE